MTNQATNSKSFIIHKDSLSVLKKLTKEEVGELFLAIADYQNEGKLPTDKLISIIFEPFLNQFKRDDEKFLNVCERNKINGSKGGRPKTQKNPVGYLETKDNPKEPKKADSDSDSNSNSDSNNYNNNNINNSIAENMITENQPLQKNIKKEIQENNFNQFWQKYEPIHTSKGSKKDAEKKFSKIIKKENFEDIMAGLERYMAYCKTKNIYTKAVSTWLNSEGWKDDYSNNAVAEDKFDRLKDFINDLMGEIVVSKVGIENNKGLFYKISDEAGDKIFTANKEIKEKIRAEFNKISPVNTFEKR